MKVKSDHRSIFQFKQLERGSLKKFRASTGFDPITYAIVLKLENTAMTTLHFQGSFSKSYCWYDNFLCYKNYNNMFTKSWAVFLMP